MDKTIKTLTEVLKESKKEGTTPYDTTAEVVRVEESTAWVHIPGGIDETPVQMTIDAKVGDVVQVRVSGGRAWITGNSSAPPTDDTIAKEARSKANSAEVKAVEASELSESAKTQAEAAARVAGNTSQHFWFTGTGTDTGAHITEKTEEEFLSDPSNGGGNLLARSNGVAVRDGLNELATFYVDQVGRTVMDLLDDNHGRLTAYYAGSNLDDTDIVLRARNDNGDSAHLDLSAWENSPAAGLIAGTKSIVLNNNGISLSGGNVVASGDITANGHFSPIGTVKTARLTTATNVARTTYSEVCNIELEAGTWLITAYVRWENNNNGVRLANIATTSGSTASNVLVPPANGNVTSINFTRIFTPTTTTTYYLNAYHNSTTTPLQMAAGNTDGTINGLRAVRIA